MAKPAHRGWHDRSHPSPSQTSSSLTPHHCVVRAATDTHQHTHTNSASVAYPRFLHTKHTSMCTSIEDPLAPESCRFKRTRAGRELMLHSTGYCNACAYSERASLQLGGCSQVLAGVRLQYPPSAVSINWIDRGGNNSSQQNAVFTTCCIRAVLGCFTRGYAKHMLIWHVDFSDLNAAPPHHHPSSSSSLHVSGGNSKSSSALKGFGRASAVSLASGRAGSARTWLAGACCDC